jgi:hypothetical protein
MHDRPIVKDVNIGRLKNVRRDDYYSETAAHLRFNVPPSCKSSTSSPNTMPLYYERQYNIRPSIPDAAEYDARAQRLSNEARLLLPCTLDVPYGSSPRERLDIFPAADATHTRCSSSSTADTGARGD